MPRTPAPLPADPASPGGRLGVFTTADARRLGIGPNRLRRADIRPLARGLFATTDAAITEAAVLAALCRADPSAVACGPSAARLYELPLPRTLASWELGDPVHLTTTTAHRVGTAVTRWSFLRLGAGESVHGAHLGATSPARTFLDLGQLLAVEDLVVLGDALVREPRAAFEARRDGAWVELEDLRRAVQAFHGRGARRLAEAVGHVRVGSDSPAETRLRRAIVAAGLPEPAPNAWIDDADGLLGQPDLQWNAWKVCLEHEGPSHLTPEQLERDIRRGDRRRAHGWIEIRTVAADVRGDCRRAVERVREALVARGWRG